MYNVYQRFKAAQSTDVYLQNDTEDEIPEQRDS